MREGKSGYKVGDIERAIDEVKSREREEERRWRKR